MVNLLAVRVSNFSAEAARVLERELQARFSGEFKISPHVYPSEMLAQLYMENCHQNLLEGQLNFPTPQYEPINGFMVMMHRGPALISIRIDQWSQSGIKCNGPLAPIQYIQRTPNTAPTAILYRVPPQPIDHLTPTEDELLPEQKN